MKKRCCINCGKIQAPPFRNPNQTYCKSPECQRVRKRIWQQQKMASDPDYKANQQNAQKEWRNANPAYYKEYRKKNETYTEKNRIRQVERNQKRRVHLQNQAGDLIAKMDAIRSNNNMNTGIYHLIPIADGKIAKMDALIVQLTVMT